MNWLAHLALAHDRPLARLGNLAGDFVRGSIAELAEQFPAELVRGIAAHRALDQFTDSHPAFIRSVRRLSPTRGLVSGIVIDIAYDHFLSASWGQWFDSDRHAFIAQCYREMREHIDVLPPRLATAAPRIAAADWLTRYLTLEGIGQALERTSRRLRFETKMAGAEADIAQHYEALTADFQQFWPDVSAFAASLPA